MAAAPMLSFRRRPARMISGWQADIAEADDGEFDI